MSLEINSSVVEAARLAKGLYLAEFAEAAGLGASTVYAAVSRGRCGLRTARSLAAALGLRIDQVVRSKPAGEGLSDGKPRG